MNDFDIVKIRLPLEGIISTTKWLRCLTGEVKLSAKLTDEVKKTHNDRYKEFFDNLRNKEQ